jgi:hypothetical protein
MNKYNINLTTFCEIYDGGKKHKALKYPMPSFIYKGYYDRLIKEFNEMFNTDNESSLLFDDISLKYEIYNEAYNLLPLLVTLLKYGYAPIELQEFIRNNYGVHDKEIPEMLEFLIAEQNRLAAKYTELTAKDKKDETKDVTPPVPPTFARVIVKVEGLLDIPINRTNTTLFMFHAQFTEAIKIKQQNTKANATNR